MTTFERNCAIVEKLIADVKRTKIITYEIIDKLNFAFARVKAICPHRTPDIYRAGDRYGGSHCKRGADFCRPEDCPMINIGISMVSLLKSLNRHHRGSLRWSDPSRFLESSC